MKKLLIFIFLLAGCLGALAQGIPTQAPYFLATVPDSTAYTVGAIGLNNDNQFTVRDGSGTFRLSIGGNNGLTRTFDNFQLGGSLIKNTSIPLSTFTLTLGSWTKLRQSGVEIGTGNTMTGTATFTHGTTSVNSGTLSAILAGESANVSGHGAVAAGRGTTASGNKSFAGGWYRTGTTAGRGPTASGHASFAFYVTDGNNTPGDGARAEGSAILGGWNSNIPASSHGSAIIGGNGIQARASDPFQTYVQNLNIAGVPDVLDTANHFLVREYSTGQIKTRPLSTLGNFWPLSGSGTTTGDVTIDGNNDLTFDNNSWTFGNRSAGSIGTRSMTVGTNNVVSGQNSAAFGFGNNVSEFQAYAFGNEITVSGQYASAFGFRSSATGTASYSFGNEAHATANYAFATGNAVTASGQSSLAGGQGVAGHHVIASGAAAFNWSSSGESQGSGHGALADRSAILGGQNHNIESGNTGAVILGGSGIKLTGTDYINHVAVPNLAIFSTPGDGGTDDLLTWNATSKKVGKVAQSNGTYTPTITEVANVTSHTAFSSVYSRVGDVVTVSGRVLITIDEMSTGTDIGISLPIASNFTASADCSGVAVASGSPVSGVEGHASGDYARIFFTSTSTGTAIYFYTFQYVVK